MTAVSSRVNRGPPGTYSQLDGAGCAACLDCRPSPLCDPPITSSRKAMASLVKDCPNYPRPQLLTRKTGRKDRDMANTNRGILHPALPPAGGRHSATQIQTLNPRASFQRQTKPGRPFDISRKKNYNK